MSNNNLHHLINLILHCLPQCQIYIAIDSGFSISDLLFCNGAIPCFTPWHFCFSKKIVVVLCTWLTKLIRSCRQKCSYIRCHHCPFKGRFDSLLNGRIPINQKFCINNVVIIQYINSSLVVVVSFSSVAKTNMFIWRSTTQNSPFSKRASPFLSSSLWTQMIFYREIWTELDFMHSLFLSQLRIVIYSMWSTLYLALGVI